VKHSFDDSFAAVREAQDQVRVLDEVNPAFFSSGAQAEGAEAFPNASNPISSPLTPARHEDITRPTS
jgi:hypothetical protein